MSLLRQNCQSLARTISLWWTRRSSWILQWTRWQFLWYQLPTFRPSSSMELVRSPNYFEQKTNNLISYKILLSSMLSFFSQFLSSTWSKWWREPNWAVEWCQYVKHHAYYPSSRSRLLTQPSTMPSRCCSTEEELCVRRVQPMQPQRRSLALGRHQQWLRIDLDSNRCLLLWKYQRRRKWRRWCPKTVGRTSSWRKWKILCDLLWQRTNRELIRIHFRLHPIHFGWLEWQRLHCNVCPRTIWWLLLLLCHDAIVRAMRKFDYFKSSVKVTSIKAYIFQKPNRTLWQEE